MSMFLGKRDDPDAEAREPSPRLLTSIPIAIVSIPERIGAEFIMEADDVAEPLGPTREPEFNKYPVEFYVTYPVVAPTSPPFELFSED